MSTVTFWFDPVCPFTWRTSRWLRDVAPRRNVDIDWRVMSLAIVNEGKDVPEQYRAPMAWSRTAQRLLVAVSKGYGQDAMQRLYTALGTRIHDQGTAHGRQVLVDALAEVELPGDLIANADDESLDDVVRASHEQGQERVGTELGSPITAIGDGPGMFGPVVVPIPKGEAAERLFDGLALLSTVPQFSEVKRVRAAF